MLTLLTKKCYICRLNPAFSAESIKDTISLTLQMRSLPVGEKGGKLWSPVCGPPQPIEFNPPLYNIVISLSPYRNFHYVCAISKSSVERSLSLVYCGDL